MALPSVKNVNMRQWGKQGLIIKLGVFFASPEGNRKHAEVSLANLATFN